MRILSLRGEESAVVVAMLDESCAGKLGLASSGIEGMASLCSIERVDGVRENAIWPLRISGESGGGGEKVICRIVAIRLWQGYIWFVSLA